MLKQARKDFSRSLFTALARMGEYLSARGIEALSCEKVVATALSLANAVTELDLSLRVVIRLRFPDEDRVRPCGYWPLTSQHPAANGGIVLKHLLECSACYEKCAALRVTQQMLPVAQDLLWMMLLPDSEKDTKSRFSRV